MELFEVIMLFILGALAGIAGHDFIIDATREFIRIIRK